MPNNQQLNRYRGNEFDNRGGVETIILTAPSTVKAPKVELYYLHLIGIYINPPMIHYLSSRRQLKTTLNTSSSTHSTIHKEAAEALLPPNARHPPGRPKKQRMRSGGEHLGARIQHCSRCGEEGHTKRTCMRPLNEQIA